MSPLVHLYLRPLQQGATECTRYTHPVIIHQGQHTCTCLSHKYADTYVHSDESDGTRRTVDTSVGSSFSVHLCTMDSDDDVFGSDDEQMFDPEGDCYDASDLEKQMEEEYNEEGNNSASDEDVRAPRSAPKDKDSSVSSATGKKRPPTANKTAAPKPTNATSKGTKAPGAAKTPARKRVKKTPVSSETVEDDTVAQKTAVSTPVLMTPEKTQGGVAIAVGDTVKIGGQSFTAMAALVHTFTKKAEYKPLPVKPTEAHTGNVKGKQIAYVYYNFTSKVPFFTLQEPAAVESTEAAPKTTKAAAKKEGEKAATEGAAAPAPRSRGRTQKQPSQETFWEDVGRLVVPSNVRLEVCMQGTS